MRKDKFFDLPLEYQEQVRSFSGKNLKLKQPGRPAVLGGLATTGLTVIEATTNFVTENATIPTSFVEVTAALAAILLTYGALRWGISNHHINRSRR